MIDLNSRRAFLRAATAAGVAWTAADLLHVEEALAWAATQTKTPGGDFVALTAAQAEVVDALASRLIPSVDGRPGAHEAGAVYFIDKALSTFNVGGKKAYVEGIADLNRRAARKKPGAGFAALPAAQQDEILHEIEQTPFFQTARFDTIVGTFSLPTLGGNRDHAGWRLLGFDHQPVFQAPFGFYDADVNRSRR